MRKRRWFSLLPSAMRQMASADFVQIERVPDEGGHQRSSEAIRGHQSGHQRSSEVIRGHQRQLEVIMGNRRSSLRGHGERST
jgi:hypothetical protein